MHTTVYGGILSQDNKTGDADWSFNELGERPVVTMAGDYIGRKLTSTLSINASSAEKSLADVYAQRFGGGPSSMHGELLIFLFTDIEGSTQRWEQTPEAMRLALRRHDALVRSAIAAAGGQVFKAAGDAFCAVFSEPAQAFAAALHAQRSIGSDGFSEVGGLKVRMAVDAGEVEARDGDYFGRPLNSVARLLAAGHGGQVLVSEGAAAWPAMLCQPIRL